MSGLLIASSIKSHVYFCSCSKLVLQITNGFVCAILSLNRLARLLLKICIKSSERARIQMLDKERCIKEHIFFDLLYVSCI